MNGSENRRGIWEPKFLLAVLLAFGGIIAAFYGVKANTDQNAKDILRVENSITVERINRLRQLKAIEDRMANRIDGLTLEVRDLNKWLIRIVQKEDNR